MHPLCRQQWASSWAAALRPGGTLITLIFPIDPAADPAVGPPFPVSPELYQQLLVPAGFELMSLQQPCPKSHEGRGGKEALALWRRV